jgi:hypothetical protein
MAGQGAQKKLAAAVFVLKWLRDFDNQDKYENARNSCFARLLRFSLWIPAIPPIQARFRSNRSCQPPPSIHPTLVQL